MKWWFSDFDGTLSKSGDDLLTVEDKKFVDEWIDSGNKFVIATGRIWSQLKILIENAGLRFDYAVCNNGAMVYNNKGELIEEIIIPFEIRKEILNRMLLVKDRWPLAYTIGEDRYDFSVADCKEIYDNKWTKVLAPKENRIEVASIDILENKDLNLINVFLNSSDKEEAKKIFGDIPGIKAIITHPNFVEIMSDKVSKAAGIDVVKKFFEIKNEDIYTSGDAENDIEMLAYTENSFVMKHADDHVKAAAKHVIENVSDIKKYL